MYDVRKATHTHTHKSRDPQTKHCVRLRPVIEMTGQFVFQFPFDFREKVSKAERSSGARKRACKETSTRRALAGRTFAESEGYKKYRLCEEFISQARPAPDQATLFVFGIFYFPRAMGRNIKKNEGCTYFKVSTKKKAYRPPVVQEQIRSLTVYHVLNP